MDKKGNSILTPIYLEIGSKQVFAVVLDWRGWYRSGGDEALALANLVAAVPLVVLLLPFLPGIVMSDGMKSLAILVGIEALLLGVVLHAIDALLVCQTTGKSPAIG